MTISADILSRFSSLLEAARETSLREPAAMTLATVDGNGRPSARVVLLREYDQHGFVFYSNTSSRKGLDIAANSAVALCFHWDALGEQVRIEGLAETVSDEQADAYFSGRARESQIGAWASLQSEELPSRELLEQRVREYESQFAGQSVPRPPQWSGYRVHPTRIEFWTNQPARLHDRVVYDWDGENWQVKRLYP